MRRMALRVIAHKHNKGYGASLKTGIRESGSDVVVIIDSNNSRDIEDIFVLLKHFKGKDNRRDCDWLAFYSY